MRTKTFVWSNKSNRREGWKPEAQPDFDPGSPVVVAHDVMEHFNDSEDFKHELQAFGSILYGRGFHSNTMAITAAMDLAGFLLQQKEKVAECHHPLARKPLPTEDEERLNLVIERAYRNFFILSITERASGVEVENAQASLRSAKGWIRLGWRVAERRFRNVARSKVNKVFENMVSSVIDETNYDYDKPKDGERLVVQFDPRDLYYNVRRISH